MSWKVSPVIVPPAVLEVITPTATPTKEHALRRLIPPDDSEHVDSDDVYADLDLPRVVGGRPYVVMNMVSTVDGKSALGTSAAGIGSRTDSRLMRQVRTGVDAVMHGAGTLRAEIVDPRVDFECVRRRVERRLSPQPLAVIVSGSLDLDLTGRFLVNGPSGTVILTASSAPDDRREALGRYARLLTAPGPAVDLEVGLRRLHDEFGVRRLLSEGGPSLNQRLLDAGLIDEVFWTVAPKLAGGRGRTIIDSDEPTLAIRARLDLVSLHEHDGELYTRYRLRRGPDGAYTT
jgi:riboflavin-specific deaminase-like protein